MSVRWFVLGSAAWLGACAAPELLPPAGEDRIPTAPRAAASDGPERVDEAPIVALATAQRFDPTAHDLATWIAVVDAQLDQLIAARGAEPPDVPQVAVTGATTEHVHGLLGACVREMRELGQDLGIWRVPAPAAGGGPRTELDCAVWLGLVSENLDAAMAGYAVPVRHAAPPPAEDPFTTLAAVFVKLRHLRGEEVGAADLAVQMRAIEGAVLAILASIEPAGRYRIDAPQSATLDVAGDELQARCEEIRQRIAAHRGSSCDVRLAKGNGAMVNAFLAAQVVRADLRLFELELVRSVRDDVDAARRAHDHALAARFLLEQLHLLGEPAVVPGRTPR